ncbi:MAG: hypothetical protein U0802_08615 [Candidatus Binatia bacterium]
MSSATYLNALLWPVALARAARQRLRPRDLAQTDAFLQRLYHPGGVTNAAMVTVLGLELGVTRWLPFGTSLLLLARRPSSGEGRARGAGDGDHHA